MAFLDEIAGTLRESPVMQKAMSFRYGSGADPYEAALREYKTQGYPAPGAPLVAVPGSRLVSPSSVT